MRIQLLLLLLSAHICGDFLLYSPQMSSAKRVPDFNRRLKAIAIHCLYHSLIIIFMLWIAAYPFFFMIRAALIIGLMHFIIDISRIYLEGRIFDKKDFTILNRKDFFSFLAGNKNTDCAPFMKKYLRRWVITNLIDQGSHIGIILIFIFVWA
jgi:hypothetical protein